MSRPTATAENSVGGGDLLQTFRRKVGAAKHLSRQEANTFIADYVAGLEGYTYLEGEAAR